jgi:hypothetical protein
LNDAIDIGILHSLYNQAPKKAVLYEKQYSSRDSLAVRGLRLWRHMKFSGKVRLSSFRCEARGLRFLLSVFYMLMSIGTNGCKSELLYYTAQLEKSQILRAGKVQMKLAAKIHLKKSVHMVKALHS